jgi:hypothetical protein
MTASTEYAAAAAARLCSVLGLVAGIGSGLLVACADDPLAAVTHPVPEPPATCVLRFDSVRPADALCGSDYLAFSDTRVGESETLEVRLVNAGSVDCKISDTQSLPGTSDFFSFPIRPLTIPPGEVATIPVTFAPSASAAGPAADSLSYDCAQNGLLLFANTAPDGSGEGYRVSFSGRSKAHFLDVAPAEIAFGEVIVDCCSAEQQATITNTGPDPITIDAVAHTIGEASFQILRAPVGTSLASGLTATFGLRFCPTVDGAKSEVLEISAHDALGAIESKTISATGTGTPHAEQPDLDVVFAFDLTGSMTPVLESAKSNSTTLMSQIAGLVPNSAFGVCSFADYLGTYGACGYEGVFGELDDFPWRLDQDVTTTTTLVSDAINRLALTQGLGGDPPEAYARALYETQFLGWRPNARRIVVIFEDELPHDCNLDFYGCGMDMGFECSTGVDPGRDGIVGTADDLTWQRVAADLRAAGVAVIAVQSATAIATYQKTWGYMTDQTGGKLVLLGSDFVRTITDAVTGVVCPGS